jgi:2-dehydropantoate 2-reductase
MRIAIFGSGAVGATARVPPDIQVAMWRKFLLIAAWSGVGAVTRAPIGVLRGQPETWTMLRQAMKEILAVARGHGVALTRSIGGSHLRTGGHSGAMQVPRCCTNS